MHKENIGVIADWNAAFMGNLPSGLTWFDGTNLYESSAFCLTPDADVAVSSFQYGKPQVKMFLNFQCNHVDKGVSYRRAFCR